MSPVNPQMQRLLQMLGSDRSLLGQLAASGGQQNTGFFDRPGVRPAMLNLGLGLLAQKDQAGTLGGAIGRAGPGAVQAFQQGQQDADLEAAMEGLPPQMQRVIMALPRAQRGLALMQMMQPEPPQVAEPGQDMEDAILELYGPVDPRTLTRDQLAKAGELARQYALERAEAGGTRVTIEGEQAASAAASKIGSASAESLLGAAETARSAIGRITTAGQMKQLLENPEARKVFGPGATVRQLLQRANSDPTARRIAAQYRALAGQGVLEGLDAFPGQISDKEREYLERISAADESLTVDELQAGLDAIERIQRSNARRYLDEIEAFDPAAFNVTPQQMGQLRALADRVRTSLGTSNDPLGIR